MPDFIPGLKFNELFYEEAVRPILVDACPNLRYTAARLGAGSEVLGYDDEMSTDHDWGPRFQLFLQEAEFASRETAVTQTLAHRLPHTFRGYPVNYAPPNAEGTRLLQPSGDGPVNHRVQVTTVRRFFRNFLQIDPFVPLTVGNWLTMPQQLLLGVTRGQIYHDDLGELPPIRERLAYYPRDVWLYLLAAQWERIGQEEHLMGRCGYRGDELGAGIIAARLAHDLMLLCFLLERRYAPYPKWFGTAFKELACAAEMEPLLRRVVAVAAWREREEALAAAYEAAARLHNELGVTDPLETAVSSFHERPFCVIDAGRFAAALRAAITDPEVRAIPTPVGSIDQFSHSTDLRAYPRLHRRLEALYR